MYSNFRDSLEKKRYLHKCSKICGNDILIIAYSHEYNISGPVTHMCNLQNIFDTIYPIISRSYGTLAILENQTE